MERSAEIVIFREITIRMVQNFYNFLNCDTYVL